VRAGAPLATTPWLFSRSACVQRAGQVRPTRGCCEPRENPRPKTAHALFSSSPSQLQEDAQFQDFCRTHFNKPEPTFRRVFDAPETPARIANTTLHHMLHPSESQVGPHASCCWLPARRNPPHAEADWGESARSHDSGRVSERPSQGRLIGWASDSSNGETSAHRHGHRADCRRSKWTTSACSTTAACTSTLPSSATHLPARRRRLGLGARRLPPKQCTKRTPLQHRRRVQRQGTISRPASTGYGHDCATRFITDWKCCSDTRPWSSRRS
jgi:hypothetical protein